MMPTDIKHNLKTTLESIQAATLRFQRPLNSVALLAVSKGQSIQLMNDLVELGQHAFGENYLQEALPKISALSAKNLEWHYIGVIQSKKAKEIAENFSWVHTVSRLKEAEKLALFRANGAPPLNICLQVKLDNTPTKSGIHPDELLELALRVNELPHLKLRGLMTLPPFTENFSEQRQYFSQLKRLFDKLRQEGLSFDTLSMGMTHDIDAAIAEGATIVRIGTGLFGPRGNHSSC